MLSHDPSLDKNVLLNDVEKIIVGRKVIFNVKEEGLEESLMEYFNVIDRENSFILDETIPYIIKYCKKGFTNFALRVSDLESIETAININKYLSTFDVRIDWIWLDCFNLNAPDKLVINELKNNNFKICFVSPELHILNNESEWGYVVENYARQLFSYGVVIDAVCTKLTDAWSKIQNERNFNERCAT